MKPDSDNEGGSEKGGGVAKDAARMIALSFSMGALIKELRKALS